MRSCVTDWGAACPLTSHWSWQLCCSDGEVSTGWASCAFRRLLFALGCGLSFSLWRQINLCPWSVNYCPPLSESQTASILTPCQRLPHSVPHFLSKFFLSQVYISFWFTIFCSCVLAASHFYISSSSHPVGLKFNQELWIPSHLPLQSRQRVKTSIVGF